MIEVSEADLERGSTQGVFQVARSKAQFEKGNLARLRGKDFRTLKKWSKPRKVLTANCTRWFGKIFIDWQTKQHIPE